jgi:hypothetical protein
MTIETLYSGPTTITMDLSALAAASGFAVGRECNQIDNTSNKFVDAIVFGRFIVGTTPTINTALNVYVWGSDASIASPTIDTLDGVDSAETLTNSGVLANALKLASSNMIFQNTSNVTYDIVPFTVAQFFGGVLPLYWGLYVGHNMVAALKTDSGNTNSFRYMGIKF